MFENTFATLRNRSDVTCRTHLIEPREKDTAFAITVAQYSRYQDATFYLTDLRNSKELWRKSASRTTWLTYHQASNLIIEQGDDFWQARDWQDWDAAPKWHLNLTTDDHIAKFGEDSMFVYRGPHNGLLAFDVHTGKQRWEVKSTNAGDGSSLIVGKSHLFYIYGEETAEHVEVTIEKRSLTDGKVEATLHNAVTLDRDWWFRAALSDDESELIFWASRNNNWIAAVDVSTF